MVAVDCSNSQHSDYIVDVVIFDRVWVRTTVVHRKHQFLLSLPYVILIPHLLNNVDPPIEGVAEPQNLHFVRVGVLEISASS